jgi:hypothetical protein
LTSPERTGKLTLGSLPAEASHTSNWSAEPEAFVNAPAHNYALAAGAAAIDAGIALAGVTTDRIGTERPQGRAYDVGAYEAVPDVVSGAELVLYALSASIVSGNWRTTTDTTAAGGAALWHPNAGAQQIASPLTSPTRYFEMSAHVDRGRKYRLWLRVRHAHPSAGARGSTSSRRHI